MDRKAVEEKIAAAETRRRQAAAQSEQIATRLAELQEEQAVVSGQAQLAEQRAQDLDRHLEQLRDELGKVEIAEARQAFQDALDARDAALAKASGVAGQLAAAVENVAVARERVDKAHQRLRALDPTANEMLRAEPDAYDEQWRALAPVIEKEFGTRLDLALVEAAARSPNYLVVDALPEHLRDLARQRRRALVKQRRP